MISGSIHLVAGLCDGCRQVSQSDTVSLTGLNAAGEGRCCQHKVVSLLG